MGGGNVGLQNAIADEVNPFSGLTTEDGGINWGSVSVSLSGYSNTSSSQRNIASQLISEGDITITSGGDTKLSDGIIIATGGDLKADVGGDFELSAATLNSKNTGSNFGLNVGLNSFGFNVANERGNSTYFESAKVNVGGAFKLKVGGNANIEGAQINANRFKGNVAGDFKFTSLQNLANSDAAGFGFNISTTGFGVNGNMSDSERQFTDNLTHISTQNGFDLTVGGTSTVTGAAMIDATGKGKFSTDKLVVANLADVDKADSFGGSISIGAGGVDNIGFNIETRDKQGISKASAIGIDVSITNDEQTASEKAAIIASLNTDADAIQSITKDESFKASIDLNVKDLRELEENVDKTANLAKALNAPLPDHLQGASPNAEALYRKSIANGATVEQATAISKTEGFIKLVKTNDQIDNLIAEKGGFQNVSKDVLQLVAMGETVLFGAASEFKGGAVLVPCPENDSKCQVELEKVVEAMKKNPNALDRVIAESSGTIEAFIETGKTLEHSGMYQLTGAFNNLLLCVEDERAPEVLATLYRKNPKAFVALTRNSSVGIKYNSSAIVNATQTFVEDGDLQTFQLSVEAMRYPSNGAFDEIVTVAGIIYDLTPIADGIAVAKAAYNKDITGVMVAGVGFIPVAKIGKLAGKGWKRLSNSALANKITAFVKNKSGAAKVVKPSKPHTKQLDEATGLVDDAIRSGTKGGLPDNGIDYSKLSTAKPHQATKPRDLNEQILWNQVLKNPSSGQKLRNLNRDPKFLLSDGFQKMETIHKLPNGTKISIHYQYNSITQKAYDMKITSPQRVPPELQPGAIIKE